jgi:LmbE family N-acetylglucosaminyl deacetylase
VTDEPRFDISQFGGEVHRLMVVAAHPDDLETTCGGTLALLIQTGVEVALLLATDGDIGTHDLSYTREGLAATRRQETLAGAQVLGIRDVFFLGHHDGELVAGLELRAEVAGAYRRWQPDTLFTFDPYWAGQAHPDHVAAGRAAVDAYMPSKIEL